MRSRVASLSDNYHRKCRGLSDRDDIYQSGLIGLSKALNAYRPPNPFEPFATRYIRGEILHYIRDYTLHFKIPSSVKEAARRVQKFSVRFEAKNGRAPSDVEIAEGTELSAARVESALFANECHKYSVPWCDVPEAAAITVPPGCEPDPSWEQAFYDRVVADWRLGMSTTDIARKYKLGRPKAHALVKHIESEETR
jgi:RNA polymerase sigma factor (sigma-70 family)